MGGESLPPLLHAASRGLAFLLLVGVIIGVMIWIENTKDVEKVEDDLIAVSRAYVFSNGTGHYVSLTIKAKRPVYVERVAISDDYLIVWGVNEEASLLKAQYIDRARTLPGVVLNAELGPGVHRLVLRLPETYQYDNVHKSLCLRAALYKVWNNTRGELMLDVEGRAYPLTAVGRLQLYEEPRVLVNSATIRNVYVYRVGGNVPWEVRPGISLSAFEGELVELLARGASEDELAGWARKVAEALYESLLNGTSKAYVASMNREVDGAEVERLYRLGVLSLVFDFEARYEDVIGEVEVGDNVRELLGRFELFRSAYLVGKYDHLGHGLRVERADKGLYVRSTGKVLCGDIYSVLVVYGETPFSLRVAGVHAPNLSVPEEVLFGERR